MASEGGGKLKQKRNQSSNKPYDRKTTLFGRLKDSVKDLLIPSWLSGSSPTKKEQDSASPDQVSNIEPNRLGQKVPSTVSDWIYEKQFQSDQFAASSVGNATVVKSSTSNIPGFGPQTLNGELCMDQSSLNIPAPNVTVGPQSQRHCIGLEGHSEPSFSSGLAKNDILLNFENENRQLKPGSLEIHFPQSVEPTVRPIMVSTRVDKNSSAERETKRQRLSSPELMRQGKPLAPAARGKPSFSSLLFCTPSKQNDTSKKANFGESSFYVGKTQYGGASSVKKKQLNSSLPYQSSLPLRKQVKARLNNSLNATTSSTAQRILDTLERMSTPLEDAKKIPQGDEGNGNDSILSFTPLSYRRQNNSAAPITRPLQLPNRGPPTSHLLSTSRIETAKNRDRSKAVRPEADSAFSITQDESTVVESVSDKRQPLQSTGKMKAKKFSQHISGHHEEEALTVPNLRTEFTLPVSAMNPISMSSEKPKAVPFAAVSTKSCAASSLQFTFSTPIEENNRPSVAQNSGLSEEGFKFSSPIHVSSSKTSAAGAEEGFKILPEPAIGAATPQLSTWMGSSQNMVKPKALSPDIGGTSSSFKSYTKWNGKSNMDAANTSPAFGVPGPACSLKKGSVMDILGGGRKSQDKKSDSSSSTVQGDSGSKDKIAPLSALFQKAPGAWECDVCMIENKASDNKCVACSAKKPGSKPSTMATPVVTPVVNNNKPLSELFKKPQGSWECGACMIQNMASDVKCVACTTPKPGASAKGKESSRTAQGSGTSSLSDLFKKPEGTWECTVCMIQNTPSFSKCVACDAPKPGGGKVDNKSNNSLAAMFKKPEGTWECDTCMVQNSSTSLRCIACDASKPGLQSAGIVSKPATSAGSSSLEILPSGGFSIKMPSTATTSTGSAGFKFGNSSVSALSSDAALPISGGFKFGSVSKNDNSVVNNSESNTGPSTGFQFGSVSSSASVSKSSGFQFGAPSTSVTFSSASSGTAGFSFSDKGNSSSLVSSSSLSSSSSSSVPGTANSHLAAPTGGFQFGSLSSSTVPGDKKSEPQTNQHNFSFGQTPAMVSPATPFVFGAPTSTVPASTGLGTGPSLSSGSAAPVVNGGFGESSAKNVFGQGSMGSSSASSGVMFGAKPSSDLSVSGTTKRSVDSADLEAPSAKVTPVFGSLAKQPVVNGGFSFNGGPKPFDPVVPATTASFSFGASKPLAPPSSNVPGGFQFSSSVPVNKPGLPAPATATPFSFNVGASSGQDTAAIKSSQVSFSTAPNFNFSAVPADKNPSSSVFQFGGSVPEASSGVFTFGAASRTPMAQPQPSSMPVFGGPPGAAGVGGFTIGANETSQRKVKKAVRRVKPR